MDGVNRKDRPITLNFKQIAIDGYKLQRTAHGGIIAFVLFPVRTDDKKWLKYLHLTGKRLDIELSEKEHCCRLPIRLENGATVDLVICCFSVPPETQFLLGSICEDRCLPSI